MADQFDDQHIQATISKLLGETARHLALFLEKVLPSLFEDWWKQAVLNSLSFQQRRRMEQHNNGSLAEACSLLSYANAGYLNDAGNMLCVSADTMAKFKCASITFLDSLEDAIETFKANGKLAESVSVKIQLAGEDCSIKWSQRHFMRLVALYEKA